MAHPRPRRLTLLASAMRRPRGVFAGALLAVGLGLGAATLPAPAAAAWLSYGLGPPEVADMLYTRYRVARVMRIVPRGDVYQAEAIDRRGYRVHFTVDAYNGEVLESFVVGRSAYEPPVPVPPGMVPGGRVQPRFPDEDLRGPPAAPQQVVPPRSRQARSPDATAPATQPRPKQTPAPRSAAPKVQPEKVQPDPAPATASRQPAEKAAPAAPAIKPTVTPPAAVDSAPKPAETRPADAAPRAPEVRQAGPAPRTPEPLIDPKTGKPPVPVAPLEDAAPVAKPPTPIVPPVTLE